jgi:hypothetical protein
MKIRARKKFEFCSQPNSLKQRFGVHHYEELVEMIETNILFAIFEAQNKKISISLVKNRDENGSDTDEYH